MYYILYNLLTITRLIVQNFVINLTLLLKSLLLTFKDEIFNDVLEYLNKTNTDETVVLNFVGCASQITSVSMTPSEL